MVAFISIFMALVLLGLTVLVLHRYQTMEVEVSVDRNTPLPPLTNTNIPEDQTTSEIDSAKTMAEPAQLDSAGSESGKLSWQEEVAELKRMGDVLGALAVCKEEFPLWSAFNQACILLRSELKSSRLSAAEKQEKLENLYRTAATAELIHDNSTEEGKLPLNILRQLEADSTEQLEMPYPELGYAHLRLIRKGDIKLMQELWGRPRVHSKPRQLHQDWWNSVVSRIG